MTFAPLPCQRWQGRVSEAALDTLRWRASERLCASLRWEQGWPVETISLEPPLLQTKHSTAGGAAVIPRKTPAAGVDVLPTSQPLGTPELPGGAD